MTPCVAKERTLFGTGYLPFFADQTYNLEGEDLALIGTSEQTLVGYHADDVLDAADLPLCYTAFTPCFRTEAGSYGKASRGIFRVHQFHKVEQIVFCKPEDSVRSTMRCAWRTRSTSSSSSASPIMWSTSASATSALRATRSMTSRRGSPDSALPRGHQQHQSDQLPEPPAEHPLQGRRHPRLRAHHQRDGGDRPGA